MDRLSALMSRFTLSVRPCAVEEANFVIIAEARTSRPAYLIYSAGEELGTLLRRTGREVVEPYAERIGEFRRIFNEDRAA